MKIIITNVCVNMLYVARMNNNGRHPINIYANELFTKYISSLE